MRRGFIVIVVIVLGVINSPWLLEGASGNCAAFERSLLSVARNIEEMVEGQRVMNISDGRMAAQVAAAHSVLPAPLTCAKLYWQRQLEVLLRLNKE